MTVTVGGFKQQKYGEIALGVRRLIMDHAENEHLTLVEAIGILEVVKIELYNEQIEGELEDE